MTTKLDEVLSEIGQLSIRQGKEQRDGAWDYAIIRTDDKGNEFVIAEVFGRLGVNTWQDAETTAQLLAAAPAMYGGLTAAEFDLGDLDDDAIDDPHVQKAFTAIYEAKDKAKGV